MSEPRPSSAEVGGGSGPESGRRLERQAREQRRREGELLAVARDLLQREGIAVLSMERLADTAGYSRTAAYHYFPSREEVVIALAIETLELRRALYERVASFDARPRERIMTLGEITCLLYPRHVVPEVVAFANAVRAKTSEIRQQRLLELEQREFTLGREIAYEAVRNGDLRLAPGVEPEEALYALHVFMHGAFASVTLASPLQTLGIADPRRTMRRFGAALLDGLGWRPLRSEWNYRETRRRIYSEVFPPSFLASYGLAAEANPALDAPTSGS